MSDVEEAFTANYLALLDWLLVHTVSSVCDARI